MAVLVKKYETPDKQEHVYPGNRWRRHFAANGNFSGQSITLARIQTLWLIAGFILLADRLVNFINISTAQAVNRSREVGVRKVLGSNRGQLRIQFLLEALVLVVGGVVLAVLLTELLTGPISRILDMPVSISVFRQGQVLLFFRADDGRCDVAKGFYPALVLSGFSPITALRTKLAWFVAAGSRFGGSWWFYSQTQGAPYHRNLAGGWPQKAELLYDRVDWA